MQLMPLASIGLALATAATSLPQDSQESDPRTTSSDPWVRELPDAEELSSGSLDPKYPDLPIGPDGSVTGDGEAEGAGGAGNGSDPANGRAAGAGAVAPPVTRATETEPNDSFGQAQAVGPSSATQGTINPLRDTDWFVFEIDRRGSTELRFSQVPSGIAPAFRLYNRDGSALTNWIYPRLVDGGSETTMLDLLEAGRYAIAVADDKHDSTSASPYELSLTFHPGDRFEPNEAFGDATPVSPDARVQGTILPKGDVDRYAFEIERRGSIEVDLLHVPDGITPALRLYNAEGSAMTNWLSPRIADGATETLILDLPAAGAYHLAIADDNSDSRSWEPYTLHLTMHTGDGDEPNDSQGTAVLVPANVARTASILPKGDSDHYTFEVERQGISTVVFENVPTELSPTFRFYDPNRSALSNWIHPKVNNGRTEPYIIDLPRPGRYTIAIADEKNDARTFGTYGLRLAHDAGDANEPNDTLGRATPIRIGAEVQGNILPLRDTDCFWFEVTSARQIEIVVANVTGEFAPSMRVHNADHSAITNWHTPNIRDRATEAWSVELKEPGKYFVALADTSHAHRAVESYRLVVR